MDGIGLLVGDLNAELLRDGLADIPKRVRPGKFHTSSIAITTSTVSRLSRPRSFEKCEEALIYHSKRVRWIYSPVHDLGIPEKRSLAADESHGRGKRLFQRTLLASETYIESLLSVIAPFRRFWEGFLKFPGFPEGNQPRERDRKKRTLSKFFSRLTIRPSTSSWFRPAGAE